MAEGDKFDFLLGEMEAMDIRDIICRDTIALEQWMEVKDYFLDDAPDRDRIRRMHQQNEDMKIIVLQTLTLWIQRKGVDATFNSCLGILTSRQLPALERKLEERRRVFKNIGGSFPKSTEAVAKKLESARITSEPLLNAHERKTSRLTDAEILKIANIAVSTNLDSDDLEQLYLALGIEGASLTDLMAKSKNAKIVIKFVYMLQAWRSRNLNASLVMLIEVLEDQGFMDCAAGLKDLLKK